MQRGRVILIMIAVCLFLFFLSTAILIINNNKSIEKQYKIEYIEGMPCIVYNTGHIGGITCDWSQWEGR